MKLKTILEQYVQEAKADPTRLAIESSGDRMDNPPSPTLPSSKSDSGLYDDNAQMFASSFTKFKEWFKKQGGQVFTASVGGGKIFVGKREGKQVWTWSPDDDTLRFDRRDSQEFSKFFNKTYN